MEEKKKKQNKLIEERPQPCNKEKIKEQLENRYNVKDKGVKKVIE